MCGICGHVTFNRDTIQPDVIRAMTAQLTHRGPDEEGYYLQPAVGLGMRRLKVLDLVSGQQPMTNEDRSVWIVFNGEIYNHVELRRELEAKGHRFVTRSDTEVIVHLYEERGVECVSALNGMFAIAIWDDRAKRLLLARDPLGIKPLYYAVRGRSLVFASELKSLLAHPAVPQTLDAASVADYFRWLYIPGPATIFQDVLKLPPGTRLVMSADGVRLERYWRPQFAQEPASAVSEEEWAERILAALRAAVRRHMVADVPVGVFLSGGVDSSAMVALARECTSGTLQTFSAGFPNMGLYDEQPYARAVAERFQCEHHALDMSPSAIEALDAVVQACDEPFGDSSAIPLYYLARFARERVTVALSGTGGDDLFAGYRRYLMARWLPRYQRVPSLVRRCVAQATGLLPAHRRNRWAQWNLLARRFCAATQNGASTLEAYLHTMTFFDAPMRRALLPGGASARDVHAQLSREPSTDALSTLLLADLSTYLPDDLLVKEDRMTMAVSLEARVPFLDREVIDIALQVPSALKLRGGSTKHILRRALAPVLPDAILRRAKHGFAVPVGEWLRGKLAPMFRDMALSSEARSREWVDQAVVRQLLARHEQGREDVSQHLWAVLVFETWCRRYLP